MAQNKKILGMTSSQVGILIALGVLACILFAVAGWFLLGGSIQLPFSRAADSTPTPRWTPTVYVLPTLTPTITPTPIPYEQLIPNGWKQFKTELIEIWLPPSFKPTDKEPVEELSLSGTSSDSSLYTIDVSVAYVPLKGESLDAHLDADISKLDSQTRLVERRKISLNGTDAVRIVLEARVDTLDVNQLTYAIQDGTTVWFITYFAQINDFYEMLPLFEQSAETFRVVR